MATFDVVKVMEILAKQEADGYTFYEEVAAAVGDDKAKKLFERLAMDERKHEAFYKKQMSKYEGKSYDLSESNLAFVNMLLRQPSPVEEAREAAGEKLVWNKRQGLTLAEKLERDTILLLSQIIDLNDDFGKEPAFTEALKEEKLHLSMILQHDMDEMASSLML